MVHQQPNTTKFHVLQVMEWKRREREEVQAIQLGNPRHSRFVKYKMASGSYAVEMVISLQ